MGDHYPLKCGLCHSCIREGEEERRLGSVTMTFWTRVGPWAMILCGRCAQSVVDALVAGGSVIAEILKERP